MAVEDRLIDVPLYGGMSEGQDSFLAGQPLVADAQNAIIEKDGSYRRRYPRSGVSLGPGMEDARHVLPGTTIPAVVTPDGLWQYSDAVNEWPVRQESAPLPADTTATPLLYASDNIRELDYVRTDSGWSVYAWVYLVGTDKYAYYAIRSPNGSWVAHTKPLLYGTVDKVRLVAIGSVVMLFFTTATSLVVRRITLSGVISESDTTVDSVYSPLLDACEGGGMAYVAYLAANGIRVAQVDPSSFATVTEAHTPVPPSVTGLTLCYRPSIPDIVLAYWYQFTVYTASLPTALWTGSTTIPLGGSSPTVATRKITRGTISWCRQGMDHGVALFLETIPIEDSELSPYTGATKTFSSGRNVQFSFVKIVYGPLLHSFEPDDRWGVVYGYALSHKAVTHSDGRFPIVGLRFRPLLLDWFNSGGAKLLPHDIALDTLAFNAVRHSSTVFITARKKTRGGNVRNIPVLVGRCDVDRSHWVSYVGGGCVSATLVGNKIFTANPIITEYLNAVPTYNAASEVVIDTRPVGIRHTNAFGEEHSCGPHTSYDGRETAECTPLSPPYASLTDHLTGFGFRLDYSNPFQNPAGQKQELAFVWYWADSTGAVHRSAPSFAHFSAVGPLAPAHVQVIVNPPLTAVNHGNFDPLDNQMYLECYRGPVGGGEPMKLLWRKPVVVSHGRFAYIQQNLPPFHDENNPPLYTTGGVVEAWAPPSVRSIAVAGSRLWALTGDQKHRVYYSKLNQPGNAVELAAEFSVVLPTTGGEATALAQLDDKAIVFCKNGIYALIGDGPNNAGEGATFAVVPVQSDTGCEERASVASTSDGVFFKGRHGIYKIDRGLNVSLVSKGVQDRVYNASMYSTFVDPAIEAVMFHTTGETLVYHYTKDAWTHLDGTMLDVCKAPNGRRLGIAESGVRLVYDDPDGVYGLYDGMIIETNWIKLSSIQGFFRAKRALWLGHNNGDVGMITVDVYHNYLKTDMPPQTAEFSGPDTCSYPGDGRIQVRVHIANQKCESIKFVFHERSYKLVSVQNQFWLVPIPARSLTTLSLLVGIMHDRGFRHNKPSSTR